MLNPIGLVDPSTLRAWPYALGGVERLTPFRHVGSWVDLTI